MNSFPIFGLIPCLGEHLGDEFELPGVYWKWEGWGDDVIWTQLQSEWSDHLDNSNRKWEYLKDTLNIPPKAKFDLYVRKSYCMEDLSEYENEIEAEFEEFEERVDTMTKEEWVEVFGMMRHGRSAPGGVDPHEFLV